MLSVHMLLHTTSLYTTSLHTSLYTRSLHMKRSLYTTSRHTISLHPCHHATNHRPSISACPHSGPVYTSRKNSKVFCSCLRDQWPLLTRGTDSCRRRLKGHPISHGVSPHITVICMVTPIYDTAGHHGSHDVSLLNLKHGMLCLAMCHHRAYSVAVTHFAPLTCHRDSYPVAMSPVTVTCLISLLSNVTLRASGQVQMLWVTSKHTPCRRHAARHFRTVPRAL